MNNNKDNCEGRKIFIGKREKVVCAKISYSLNEAVRRIVREENRFRSINDFVEEAVLDKVLKISESRENEEGC